MSRGSRKRQAIQRPALVHRFARRIREVRLKLGLKQVELAQKAGLTPAYLARIEAGATEVGIGVAGRLAEALGQSIGELLPVKDAKPASIQPALARKRLESILARNDPITLGVLLPLLNLLDEAGARRNSRV